MILGPIVMKEIFEDEDHDLSCFLADASASSGTASPRSSTCAFSALWSLQVDAVGIHAEGFESTVRCRGDRSPNVGKGGGGRTFSGNQSGVGPNIACVLASS